MILLDYQPSNSKKYVLKLYQDMGVEGLHHEPKGVSVRFFCPTKGRRHQGSLPSFMTVQLPKAE